MNKLQFQDLLKALSLASVILLAKPLFADTGGGVSGSGSVIRCKVGEQSGAAKYSYQLLDYYDSKKQNGFGFKLDLGPGETYQEKIEYVLNRLSKIDPYRAHLYKEYASSFIPDSEFFEGKKQATQPLDLGSGYILPKGCKILRTIIQRSETEATLYDNFKKYEIVGSIWKNLDQTTIAGLILHEIAYREVLTFTSVQSSIKIRRFVALISSTDLLHANYPYEILRSGLEFWGESYEQSSYGKYEPMDGILRRRATNFIILGNFMDKSVHVSNRELFVNYRLNDQILRCKVMSYTSYDSRVSLKDVTNVYLKLISSGQMISDLKYNGMLNFSKCIGQLTLNNKMFGAKVDFELQGDLNGRSVFRIESTGFSDFYVHHGVVDGVEISNVKCSLNDSGDLNCK